MKRTRKKLQLAKAKINKIWKILKKRNEEIDIELIDAENKYNLVNNNLKEIQEKLSSLREDKARKEATIEGIENRKKDLLYTIKNELRIDDASLLLASSNLVDLNKDEYPEIQAIAKSVEDSKKKRVAWLSKFES